MLNDSGESAQSRRNDCSISAVMVRNLARNSQKLRTKLAEAAVPQLVQLEPMSEPVELLQISYRGAELKLPVGVDMDAVSAILRSIQSL